VHPLSSHLQRTRQSSGLSNDVIRRIQTDLDRIELLEARILELETENATLKGDMLTKRARKESA
jgi:cell division protein FtsB